MKVDDTERAKAKGRRQHPRRASRHPSPRALELDAPLPLSPDLSRVVLPNGFTCWIWPHQRPIRGVALCLRIESGSLDEEDDERGISHLLEHMAFRGSINFRPGALHELFASMGTRLGRHQNASTSLDHTSFTLWLPDAEDRALETFLLCLADFAYRLNLLPEELEGERRVVLEELRAYPRSEGRLRERILGLVVPGARLAARQPLGTEESLRALTAEHLRLHYSRWYRPDNSALLVVGDIDPRRVEECVQRHFAAWPAVIDPRRSADPGIRPSLESRAAVIEDPDVTEPEVRVITVLPPAPMRTTGDLRARLVERLAVWLFNRQIDALTREDGAAFRDAQLDLSPLVHACTLGRATIHGAADRIEDLVSDFLVELKRAAVHPYPPAELARGKAALLTGARQAAASERNRRSESLLAELEQTLGEGHVPIGKAHAVRCVEALLPGVTGEEVRDAVAASFLTPAKVIVALVPERPQRRAPAEERLLAGLRRVESLSVGPPVSRGHPHRLMARRPRAGAVTAVEDDEELGLRSAVLSNGVRLHLRPMEYRKGRVFVTVVLAGGRLRESAANLGVTSAAAVAWSEPSTDRLSSVAIRDYLSGKALAFDTRVEEDTLELHLAADPAFLEDGLRLLHLLLTRPRVSVSALRRWRARTREYAEARGRSLEMQLAERALGLLTGGDPRFGIVTAARVDAIGVQEAQQWLDDVLCPAPLEAALVGDMACERMMDLALRYLGSLPPRPLADADLAGLRALTPVRGPLRSTLAVGAGAPAAAVLVGWQAAPWQAVRERRVLQMAEQVLLQRVRRELREERAISYSPEVSYSPSRAYPAASLLSSSSYAEPERADEAVELLRSTAQRLAAEGPSEDEMHTVRRQFADLAEQSQQDPKYWCRALAELDYRNAKLDDLKGLARSFATCSGAAMRDVLSRVVTEEREISVLGVPS